MIDDLKRGMSQATVLLALLDAKDTAKLEGFWPRVPADQRPTLSACLHELASAVIAGLPAHKRVAAFDRRRELCEATGAATSPVQQVACIYGQARQIVEILTELMPDQHARLARYTQRLNRGA